MPKRMGFFHENFWSELKSLIFERFWLLFYHKFQQRNLLAQFLRIPWFYIWPKFKASTFEPFCSFYQKISTNIFLHSIPNCLVFESVFEYSFLFILKSKAFKSRVFFTNPRLSHPQKPVCFQQIIPIPFVYSYFGSLWRIYWTFLRIYLNSLVLSFLAVLIQT